MVIISGLDLGDFEGILYHYLKDWIFCVTSTKIRKNITRIFHFSKMRNCVGIP